ncbi:MAG: DUF6089 family protein [Ekhidna sp.]
MRLKSLLVVFLSVIMLGITYDADAQKRKKNKYKKRKKTSKNVSNYRGGPVGYGRFKPYYYVGAAANAGNYYGDLAPIARAASSDVSFTRPGFGIYGGYKFFHSLSVRAGFNWVRVAADDFSADPSNVEDGLARYARNLSFRNDIKEFQLGLEISLLPNYGGMKQRLPINAYLFVGGAVFLHDPMGQVPDFDYQTDNNGTVAAPQAGEWVKLRPLQTEGVEYDNVEFSIPVALGAKMRIPKTNFDVGIEFGIRYLFTDRIDDVSDSYVALDQFADPLARILSDRSAELVSARSGDTRDFSSFSVIQNNSHGFFTNNLTGAGSDGAVRGNPDNDDQIFITQIKLTYNIGSNGRSRAKFR